FSSATLVVLSHVIPLFGLLVCIAEVIYEVRSFLRQNGFFHEFQSAPDKFQFLHSFLHLNAQEQANVENAVQEKFPDLSFEDLNKKKEECVQDEIDIKANFLARRIQPWLVKRIHKHIPWILEAKNSIDSEIQTKAAAKADTLFKEVEMQYYKRR